MESMRGTQANWHLPMAPLPAHAAGDKLNNTDPSFSAHFVDLNRLNNVMREKILVQTSVCLAKIRRNDSVFLLSGPPGSAGGILAIATGEMSLFPSLHKLSELIFVGDTAYRPHATMGYLIVPNSRANVWLRSWGVFEDVNRVATQFGMLDHCIYPHCPQCRQSALCLNGQMVFAVCLRIALHNYEVPLSSYKIGDCSSAINIGVHKIDSLNQPFFPLQHEDREMAVMATLTNNSSVCVEFTRST